MFRRILHDQERGPVVGYVIVAALAGTVADRQPVKQVITAVECLAQLQQIPFPSQLDAQFPAHRAGAAITASNT